MVVDENDRHLRLAKRGVKFRIDTHQRTPAMTLLEKLAGKADGKQTLSGRTVAAHPEPVQPSPHAAFCQVQGGSELRRVNESFTGRFPARPGHDDQHRPTRYLKPFGRHGFRLLGAGSENARWKTACRQKTV
jgi:hypothetical protein